MPIARLTVNECEEQLPNSTLFFADLALAVKENVAKTLEIHRFNLLPLRGIYQGKSSIWWLKWRLFPVTERYRAI